MEEISEAEISMVLDTYMYLNYSGAKDGSTLSDILKELENLPDYREGGSHCGEYTILKQAAENEAIGNLVIGCQSANLGYDSGTAACTFSTPDQSTIYVVYRGTGDGEWPDNGIGMSKEDTLQQKRALKYFDQVVETMGIGAAQRLIVTGHSKGGNKSQYVTMESRYSDLVDVCYSVDGQGFSPEAIESWKCAYGEEYEERVKKLQGIYGENDYVSVLGIGIIPKENIRYVKTPVTHGNFAGYHDIKYMFAYEGKDPKTGNSITLFRGRKNYYVSGRGELGNYGAVLSGAVMALPADTRDGCAAVVMQMMEALQGAKTGINGERLKLSDCLDFILQGMPVIKGSLLLSEEGRSLLGVLAGKKELSKTVPGDVYLEVKPAWILDCGQQLEQTTVRIAGLKEQIAKSAESIPLYLTGSVGMYQKMKLAAGMIGKLEKQLRDMSLVYEQIAEAYRKWEQDAWERAAGVIDFLGKIE